MTEKTYERTGISAPKNALAQLGDFLREYAGLCFRGVQLERLLRAAQEEKKRLALEEWDDYLAVLRRGGEECERLLNSVTNGETYFWRGREQMETLGRIILPQLISRRRGGGGLYLLSAGCSSGEEPYTLAMLLHRTLPAAGEWRSPIIAVDINSDSLEKARRGIYRRNSFREGYLPSQPFFSEIAAGEWELSPQIKKFVHFRRLNLAQEINRLNDFLPVGFDLILCRNVLIYWHPEKAARLAASLYRALKPGGYLLLGPAEMSPAFQMFERVCAGGAVFYRRAA